MTQLKYKKTVGVVLFRKNYSSKLVASLWLKNVKRNKAGNVTKGYVVNGAWNFERKGDLELAKDRHGDVVNSWDACHFDEIAVQFDWIEYEEGSYSCYNEVLQRAQAVMDNDPNYEYKFKSKEQIKKYKEKLKQLNDMWNDDIVF